MRSEVFWYSSSNQKIDLFDIYQKHILLCEALKRNFPEADLLVVLEGNFAQKHWTHTLTP
jgi:hypothetical protein